ncbi:MAG TPA: BtpA/SgcQ family protein [Gemmatimonadaceae bacterium]|nr:BtpA/SgcQ family protein [Gemmatimonadaceae bacterium]
MSRFRTLFPMARPVIGMIALPPMPGYPAFTSIDAVIDAALADLEHLEAGGVDGALVENDFDQPHTMVGGAEIHSAMTRVTREVVARATIPIGVEVLLNDWRASLAIAAMTGARFIRIDFFVDRVMTKLGPFEPEPEAILAYRQAIRAEHVQLYTDLQVKYTTMIGGPKPLAQSAREAAAAGADAVIISGAETGIGPDPADLRAAHAASLPVLIGSGLTPENASALVPFADGAIVGTSLRSGRHHGDRVVQERVTRLVQAVRAVPSTPLA